MDEDELPDADLWEAKVNSGMSESQATAYVERRRLQSAARPRSITERFKARDLPGMGFGRQLSQMTTVGLGDEIEGVVGGVAGMLRGKGFGESYRLAKGQDQALRDDYAERHPGRNLAATVVGGAAALPSAVGAARFATPAARAAARVAPSAGRAVAEGAAVGGVYGFNETDGGLMGRGFGGVVGAGFGAAGGALLHGAFQPLARPVAGTVSRAIVGGVGGAMAPADEPGERTRNVLTGAAALTALPYAGRTVWALNRTGAVGDVGSVVDGAARRRGDAAPETAGLVKVLRALRGDKPDLDLEAAAVAARDETKPLSIIDQGNNLRGLARAARAVGGRAKQEIPEVLGQRGKEQGQRMSADVLETTGVGERVNTRATLDQMADERLAAGNASYGKLWEQFPDAIDDPEILRVVDDLTEAMPDARGEVDDFVNFRVRRGKDKAETYYTVAKDADGNEVRRPTLRYLDLLKQAVDRQLNFTKRDPVAARKFGEKLEGEVKGARGELVDRLDAYTGGGNPEASPYRATRKEWGDKTEAMQMGDWGSEFLSTPADVVAERFSNASKAGRDVFVKTAVDDLFRYIEGVSGRFDMTKRKAFDLDVPDTKRKLEIIHQENPEAFNTLKARFAKEVEMAKSEGFIEGNSQTADKLMELGQVFDVPVEQLLTGGKEGLVRAVWNYGANRTRAGYTSRAADQLVEPLLAGANGARGKYADLLDALTKVEKQRLAREQYSGGARRAGAAVGGTGVGNLAR